MTRAFSPHSLEEALRFLAGDPDLVPVAGCTDLMVAEPERRRGMPGVIDLLHIPEIHGIRGDGEGIRIGATTTFAEIARSRRLRSAFPVLVQAAAVIGGWQIQNRATLGGNIANASPAGDSLPVLLALEAVVVAAGWEGLREIPYSRFHVEYRKTALRRGEIIAWVKLPQPSARAIQFFRKVGTREAQAISKVVVAMTARLVSGRLEDVRLGAGSVAPVPVRLHAAEAASNGRPPDAMVAAEAAEAAMAEIRPIDDVRSTAAYRRFVLGRLVRRMILQAGARRPMSRRAQRS